MIYGTRLIAAFLWDRFHSSDEGASMKTLGSYREYDLGSMLGMLRNRAELTQEGLGHLVGVSDTTIRKWESGLSSPRAGNLKKLIELYVHRAVLTSGNEREEAQELWIKASLNEAFDEAWFTKLMNDWQQVISPAMPLTFEPIKEKFHLQHNLPQRNYQNFFGRQEELQKLKTLLLPYPRSRHFLTAIDGIGGVGKSALALELAYYYRDNHASLPPEERFDTILWVSAKRTLLSANGIQQRPQAFSNLMDLYLELEAVMELSVELQTDLDQHRRLVEHALSGIHTLLIIDNLETVDDEALLTFLRELPEPTKAIVTTRYRIDIAYAIRLSGLPYKDALELASLEAELKGVELSSSSIDALYRRTGGIPLALVWSIGLMSLGYGVESVVRRLGHHHSDIARFCFEEAVAHIRDSDAYYLLLALALFDNGARRYIVGDVAGLADDEIRRDDGLAELLQLSLVNQESDRFSLLPLTRSYILDDLAQQPILEEQLRERWGKYLTE
jgi:transcriptional regulator with XRE-family HTH domain